MADRDTPPSRAEQRMAAVAKLKRAASLPRMKDGRRPPMHVEAVSEGEKPQGDEEKVVTEEIKVNDEPEPEPEPEPAVDEEEQEVVESKGSDPDMDYAPTPAQKNVDTELEADTEPEEISASPSLVFKKRRSRSRSRSRGSKDLKAKMRANQSLVPQLGGDSSQEENPLFSSSPMLPMIPPLLSPIPHFPFLQQSRFLRSPTPASPEMSLFYPGTSPPTPLPTLEDLQMGLMRSNSAGASAAGRRMAMHKLTGGTESYDPAPSPTPPPFLSKLGRNNTVSGGERIAARQNMLSRLGTRVNKGADAELVSGAEDRGAASPTHRKRKGRPRRTSKTVNTNPTISESDYNSTNPNTPAISNTSLPTRQDYYAELRAQSTTPNQLSSSRNHSSERISEDSPPPLPPSVTRPMEEEPRGPELGRRRSVLIEDPDDEDRDSPEPPEQRYLGLPGTPQHSFQQFDGLRTNHSSDGPSSGSTDSALGSGVGVPVFLSQRSTSRNEVYPSSPFTTPIKEKTLSDEDEDERVLYPASTVRPRTPYANQVDNYDREISWIASPVPEIRMPIDDDDDDDDDEPQQDVEVEVGLDEYDEEPPLSATSSNGFLPGVYDDNTRETYDENSPPASSSSKSVLVESETSPEHPSSYMPASPSSPTPFSHPPSVDGSSSPPFFPTRLSVASRIGDRSPLGGEFSDLEEKYSGADSSKREPSATTWEKVKNTFSRAGSSTGRRSRTNSILTRERRDHTDSSVSRESGASLTSTKTDKGDFSGAGTQLQAPPLMQSPSASASILSLSPHAPPRSSVSPIPPPSSSDMSKYQNAKLFPFPGMLKLEEERRAKGLPMHDDAPAQPNEQIFFNTPTQTLDVNRERELLHQTSDTPLFQKYGGESSSSGPSSPYYPDYIDVSPSTQQNGSSYNLKLPTTLPGVKQWLSKNSKKKVSPTGTANGSAPYSPIMQSQNVPMANKKPSISDVFGRKTNDLSNDVEENNPTPTTSTNGDILIGNQDMNPTLNGLAPNRFKSIESDSLEKSQTPKLHNIVPLDLNIGHGSLFKFPNEPASTIRLTSPTPDPSSTSDYPAPSASESSSTTSSQYSLGLQGPTVLERLEDNLTRASRSPMWSSVTDDPPRKLVLSSPVLQVVNPNTVKDRFLFLFNDILIIAKPVTYDQDSLMDTYKMSLPDRKYTVKSIVQLRNLRFCSEMPGKTTNLGSRNPLLRSFVSQFSKEPDHAIASLFTKSNVPDNGLLLGQLLFKTLELDRSRLGEYLSRKSSKTILKSYLDSFGFAGLRIDVALRVFLHSLNVSRHSQSYTAFDHLLDSFASRWYEANAKFVAYDKDMAVRLVWALAQLNDRLHGGIADEPGTTDHVSRNVTNKEYVDAFRRYDARYLVSDELLQELYRSIYHERLCQACPSLSNGSQETPITIKRPLPSTLTYKAQSEPIVFRLPQADPLFTIELYGQDMIFDPPILHFSRSSEASFRVMGTSLGPKCITMCRSGPNAIKYSGLPLSHTVVVERAFMRHTFQIAFLNQSGAKRRYMFSVDDPIIRNEWATSLRRHIDFSMTSVQAPSGPSSSPGGSKFHKAANAIAFKVLQDTLMGKTAGSTRRANALCSAQNSSNGTSPPHHAGSVVPFAGSVRSKSRSRTYHKHGAGKNEQDLGHRSDNFSRESNDSTPESDKANTPEHQFDGALWTARDLEMHCQQNSSISLILSFLQVGAPDGPPS